MAPRFGIVCINAPWYELDSEQIAEVLCVIVGSLVSLVPAFHLPQSLTHFPKSALVVCINTRVLKTLSDVSILTRIIFLLIPFPPRNIHINNSKNFGIELGSLSVKVKIEFMAGCLGHKEREEILGMTNCSLGAHGYWFRYRFWGYKQKALILTKTIKVDFCLALPKLHFTAEENGDKCVLFSVKK